MEVRRVWTCKDVVFAEGGLPALKPVTRVAACAVVANPFADKPRDDLSELVVFGTELGELLINEAKAQLPGPAISYGKAAIVGTSGDIEHAAAILHPRMGKPMREAIGGGQAIIPSNVKIGAVGVMAMRSPPRNSRATRCSGARRRKPASSTSRSRRFGSSHGM